MLTIASIPLFRISPALILLKPYPFAGSIGKGIIKSFDLTSYNVTSKPNLFLKNEASKPISLVVFNSGLINGLLAVDGIEYIGDPVKGMSIDAYVERI